MTIGGGISFPHLGKHAFSPRQGISFGQAGVGGEIDRGGPVSWRGRPSPHSKLGTLMVLVQQMCACGEKYWPNQKWIHEKCGVVNHQETVTVAAKVVVNRSKDRHKPRKEYMREYMRKLRANPKPA